MVLKLAVGIVIPGANSQFSVAIGVKDVLILENIETVVLSYNCPVFVTSILYLILSL